MKRIIKKIYLILFINFFAIGNLLNVNTVLAVDQDPMQTGVEEEQQIEQEMELPTGNLEEDRNAAAENQVTDMDVSSQETDTLPALLPESQEEIENSTPESSESEEEILLRTRAAPYPVSDFYQLKNVIEKAAGKIEIEVLNDFKFSGVIVVPEAADITLYSQPGENYILTAEAGFRHFQIGKYRVKGGALTLRDITLEGQLLSGVSGGGVEVRTDGLLTLLGNAIIRYCYMFSANGAAVDIEGGRMILDGGEVSQNKTNEDGGGIYIYGNSSIPGSLIVKDGVIKENQPSGVFVMGASDEEYGRDWSMMELSGGRISNNKKYGVYISRASFHMNGGEIAENLNRGLYVNRYSKLTLNGGNIEGNRGGIHIVSRSIPAGKKPRDLEITDMTIRNNKGVPRGGGLYVEGERINQLKIGSGTMIEGNQAAYGGGIGLEESAKGSTLLIDGGEISYNKSTARDVAAQGGGGIFFLGSENSTLQINSGRICGNETTMSGGGIDFRPGNGSSGFGGGNRFVMHSGVIENNKANIDGGGVFALVPEFSVTGGMVQGNTAVNKGGGIRYDYKDKGGSIQISGCTFEGNILTSTKQSADGGAFSCEAIKLPSMEVSGDVIFTGNKVGTSGFAIPPHNIASLYPKIQFAQSSFSGSQILNPDHVLNNYDISYLVNTITYDPNGGKGRPFADILDKNGYLIRSNADPNLQYTNGNRVFLGWSTKPSKGEGKMYFPGDLMKNETFAILYAQWSDGTSLSLSNKVTGTYANKEKEFQFTIMLKDEKNIPVQGTIYYSGSAIENGASAPADGSLIFDSAGQASICLKHGQAITMDALPKGYQYQIIAAAEAGYTTTYNGAVKGNGESGSIADNAVNISVGYHCNTVPETGVKESASSSQEEAGSLTMILIAAGSIGIFLRCQSKRFTL